MGVFLLISRHPAEHRKFSGASPPLGVPMGCAADTRRGGTVDAPRALESRTVNVDDLKSLLAAVAAGRTPVDAAMERLRALPFEDLGFATVDHHRQLRCGHPEVIFCQGKTVEHVVGIAQ